MFICIFVYTVLLVLNYTIYGQITIWHNNSNSKIYSIFVASILLITLATNSFQIEKEKKQAAISDMEYKECLKNKAIDKKDGDDEFTKFLLSDQFDCLPVNKWKQYYW